MINEFRQFKNNNSNHNIIANQTKIYPNGKYKGKFENRMRDGKGIFYCNNGDRYERDWKNGIREGKGIDYYNNGDREIWDYLYGLEIEKQVSLHANGNMSSKNY